MSAYVPLPWLNSSDQFLQAIIAGGQAGAQRDRLRLAAAEQASSGSRPRYGSPLISQNPVDPRIAAEAASIDSKTRLKEEEDAAAKEAYALNESLISRGATPQEAYAQSGLERFGAKPPEGSLGTDKIFEVGGQVVKVNPLSGNTNVLFTAPTKPPTEHRYSGPVMTDPIFNKPTATANLTLNEWRDMAKSLPENITTNSPVSQYIKWGTPTNAVPAPAITSTNQFAPYKVPMMPYGNMVGGSPADFRAPALDAVQEVVKTLKDGRRAVFDANSKQFLRYAD